MYSFKYIIIDINKFNEHEVELAGYFESIIINSYAKVSLLGETQIKNITIASNSQPVIETTDSSV